MTEVVKNKYETVIVLSAKLGEEGNAELVEKFKALIAKHGTVESVDEWVREDSRIRSTRKPKATTPS